MGSAAPDIAQVRLSRSDERQTDGRAMLQLDIFTAFAICGGSAAMAAGLMRPGQGEDAELAAALRCGRDAFVVLAVSLTSVLALDWMPVPWAQALLTAGAVSGVAMMGWAVARLAGTPAPRWSPWWLPLGVSLAVAAVVPLGLAGMNIAVAVGLTLAASWVVWLGRHLAWRPRSTNERLVGLAAVLMLASSLLRVGYLVGWSGPFGPTLMHMPAWLVTPFALLYGMLPVTFAMLFINTVNERLRQRLHERAMTDHLTGAMSRHALADGAQRIVGSVRRSGDELAVVMIDLDHFKTINDRHGHACGDAVLRHAALVLRRQLRAGTLLVRYGGEEFLALVPVDDLPAARRVAERMRLALEDAPWADVLGTPTKATASLGVALLGSDEDLERAISRADEALYRAKASGRNQVQVALLAA